jgi:hypothetical protein
LGLGAAAGWDKCPGAHQGEQSLGARRADREWIWDLCLIRRERRRSIVGMQHHGIRHP